LCGRWRGLGRKATAHFLVGKFCGVKKEEGWGEIVSSN